MLQEKINKDYIEAMKAKDKERSSTINFLRAQIKNIVIEKRVDSLDDQEVIAVIKKQVKQRQDSIEQFSNAGRTELVEKEQKELEILKEYLPEELSQEALKAFVDQAITETGATSMKDMGGVMKLVLEKANGQADNKVLSQLVKDGLQNL